MCFLHCAAGKNHRARGCNSVNTVTSLTCLQTVLLVLDYALGYANSTSKTVGPLLFYWYVHPSVRVTLL
jgi:hypothetical protein